MTGPYTSKMQNHRPSLAKAISKLSCCYFRTLTESKITTFRPFWVPRNAWWKVMPEPLNMYMAFPVHNAADTKIRGLLKNNQNLTIFSPKAGPMKDGMLQRNDICCTVEMVAFWNMKILCAVIVRYCSGNLATNKKGEQSQKEFGCTYSPQKWDISMHKFVHSYMQFYHLYHIYHNC